MGLLAYALGDGHRGIDLLVRVVQGRGQFEDAEGWRLQQVSEAKMVVCFRPSGLSKQTAGSLKAPAGRVTAGLIYVRSMYEVRVAGRPTSVIGVASHNGVFGLNARIESKTWVSTAHTTTTLEPRNRSEVSTCGQERCITRDPECHDFKDTCAVALTCTD